MAVIIDEVDASIAAPPAATPPAATNQPAPAKPELAELRAQLAELEQRRARLRAD